MAIEYDSNFYETINGGSERSACVVVPLILEMFSSQVSTVVDVGCGQGVWSRAFEDHGCDVTGIDGPYVTDVIIENFVPSDLASDFPAFDSSFDMAISLEVAEHLPESRADSFVSYMASLSDNILFSAAAPYQGGVNHVNERPPAYWAEKFSSLGFSVTGKFRWMIWEDERIENWYRQNILICSKTPSLWSDGLFVGESAKPLYVVHPVLWESRQ